VTEDNKVCRPDREECAFALRVADEARKLLVQLIEGRRPDAENFIDLCSDLYALEGHIIGGIPIEERANELMQADENDMIDRSRPTGRTPQNEALDLSPFKIEHAPGRVNLTVLEGQIILSLPDTLIILYRDGSTVRAARLVSMDDQQILLALSNLILGLG